LITVTIFTAHLGSKIFVFFRREDEFPASRSCLWQESREFINYELRITNYESEEMTFKPGSLIRLKSSEVKNQRSKLKAIF